MNLGAFALRNLSRNRSRTIATGVAIMIGVAALVFARGWVDGVTKSVREYATDSRLGAIQINAAGYSNVTNLLPVDIYHKHPKALIDAVRSTPGVAAVTQRIHFAGSLSNGEQDTLVLATAVEPAGEAKVCPTFLTNDLKSGRLLTDKDTDSIVVGAELAASLKLKPGSQVTLEARGVTGQMNALDVEVVGVAASSLPDEGKWLVVLPLDTARKLIGMDEDEGTTALVVRLDDLDRATELTATLAAKLGPTVEVRSWHVTGAYFDQAIKTFTKAQSLLLLVIGLLALLVVANTQMLSASERTKEIGTLTALGAPRKLVRRMFITESFIVGCVSALLGALVGTIACILTARVGIPFKPPNQPVVLVHPVASLSAAGLWSMFAMIIAVVGAFLPAWIASRKSPLEAMR